MLSSVDILALLVSPKTGVYQNNATMELVALAVHPDSGVTYELGRCGLELPEDQQREWGRQVWRNLIEQSKAARVGNDGAE